MSRAALLGRGGGTLLFLSLATSCGRIDGPAASPAARPDDAAAGDGSGGIAEDVARWRTRVVDARTIAGTSDLSIFVDDAGAPHIAYTSAENDAASLHHAWLDAGEFRSEVVDGYGRGRRKAWVAGSPELRLVYDHLTYSVVGFHAVRSSSEGWTVEVLPFADSSAATSAIWQDDRLLLAHLTAARGGEVPGLDPLSIFRQGVVYDGRSSPETATRFATEAIKPLLALAVDRTGTAHIAYTAPDDDFTRYPLEADLPLAQTVRYVAVRDDAWSEPETLTAAPGQYVGLSLALDGGDQVHVTYSEFASYSADTSELVTPPLAITWLRRSAGATAWERQRVPESASARLARGSLAVSAAGDVHLVYCTAVGVDRCDTLLHAQERAGVWSVERIDGGCPGLGHLASLALDVSGGVHVAYLTCESSLMYATADALEPSTR